MLGAQSRPARVLQGPDEGAETDGDGAEVGDLVDLDLGVETAAGLQDGAHLVGGDGVDAAAEGDQLEDKDSELLVVEEMAAHPTFCTDDLDVGYMIYNHMGEQNGDATVQIIRFTPDLARRMGEAYIMFSASQNSWSKAHVNGKEQFSPIIESPYIFITGDYVLGILFNTYVDDVRTTGVAYSQTGSLNGPWVIDAEPLLPAGMAVSGMFDDYDGTPVLVASTDTIIGGEKRSVTRLLKADTEFDKLQIKGYYKF